MQRSLYRIIDANFNRSREAARVVEEFCRFTLNSSSLTSRTKQLRHELSSAVAQLDTARLIASRDTLADVGVAMAVTNQLSRTDLTDTFTAAAKRLTEALRVLAETTQPIKPKTAQTFEQLRYTAYTLEKDITLFADSQEKFKSVALYIIITSSDPDHILSLTRACIAGGADCIQLRAKDLDSAQLFDIATEFVKLCKSANVISIINDRPDIAIASGADGIHLGTDDLPIDQVRRLQLSPLIIGLTTHNMTQLKTACLHNPAYVSLGSVFATPTKPNLASAGLDFVSDGVKFLADTGIGHVAIGGITLDNVDEVINAGAKTIATCSAATKSPNPTKTTKTLKAKLST